MCGVGGILLVNINAAAAPRAFSGLREVRLRAIAFAMVIVLQAPVQQPMVLERARVGPISIGATAQSVYDKFGDRVRLIDLKLEGMLSPALEVRLFGSQLVPSIVAEIGAVNSQLVVTRIHVVDPSLRTTSGPKRLWDIRDPNQVPRDVRIVGIMLTR